MVDHIAAGAYSVSTAVNVSEMYTPARTAPQNRNPQWHKVCKTLPLLAQKLGPNPYPYWPKSTLKKVPSVARLLFKSGLFVRFVVHSANLLLFFDILRSPGTMGGIRGGGLADPLLLGILLVLK